MRERSRAWSLDAGEGGLAGGLMFLAIEMVASSAMFGMPGLFRPLRMMSALVLGAPALDPGYSLSTAIIIGLTVHVMLSVCFALLFLAVAQPWVLQSPSTVFVLAVLYGPLLWLINLYLIAPAAGWTWFPQGSSPLIQCTAHALYGVRLGMALKRPAISEVDAQIEDVSPVRHL